MAITKVSEVSGDYPSDGGTHTQSFAALSLLENDVLVISQSADSSLTSLGLERDQGYTIHYATGTSPGRLLATKRMGATPDANATFAPGAADHTYAIQVWRGVDTSTLLDVALPAEATGDSANPNSPSATTATNGALVISVAHLDDDDALVSVTPSGYTNMISDNTGQASSTVGATVAMASKIIASAGAENPGEWTMDSSDAWAANTLALRPAAASSISAVVHHRKMLGMQ